MFVLNRNLTIQNLTIVPSQPLQWFKCKPIMLLWLNIWSPNFDVIWILMELLGCVVYWTRHVSDEASFCMDIHFLVCHLRCICHNFKIFSQCSSCSYFSHHDSLPWWIIPSKIQPQLDITPFYHIYQSGHRKERSNYLKQNHKTDLMGLFSLFQ